MSSHPEFAEIHQFPAPLQKVVVGRLRAAIISGALAPGDRLNEAQLAKMLKISRPSLREAVRQIETEGLVEIIPNVGPVVRKRTIAEFKDIHDLRRVIEGLCARYIAERASESEIERIANSALSLEVALGQADVAEIRRAKQIYYEAFAAGCGSEQIEKYVLQLAAMTSYTWGSSVITPGRTAEAVCELRRLIEAIRNRQPEHAADAAQTIMLHASMSTLQVQATREPNAAKTVSKRAGKTKPAS